MTVRICPAAPITVGYGYMAVELREFDTEERRRLARKGAAMPDGSFPIVTREDLMNAVHAIGRASNPEAAKRHIIKRARALGLTGMLPEGWGTAHMSSSRAMLSFWRVFDASEKQGADVSTSFQNAREAAKAFE